ncbi:MAG: RecX family transcriptional regulator [Spirochaetota bacterium]|nr:RecX family transcriptional regulator [Spirochaetota bacterium]
MKERNLDKKAQGENSSSQNVKLSILKIIRRGARSGKAEVLLSNGSSFFVPRKMILQNDLKSGMTLTDLQAEELKIRSEYILAKKKALELLGSREHSVYQLKQKLLQRTFSLENVTRVLLELQEEGLLSNSRFIEVWTSSRLRRHPEGFRSLYAGLVKAGISSEEARNYLIPYLEELDMEDVLTRAAEKVMKKSNISKEKLIRTLINRGFEYSSIIKFVEQKYTE